MIEIKVKDKTLLKARDMAAEMGAIRNSISKGGGNVAGFIGELVVLDLLEKAKHKSTKDYDIILPDGLKLDVKTKKTSVKPKPEYDNSVAELSTHQQCDMYAFTRVLNDYSTCWFLGMIEHDRYFELARYLKKGTVDPSNGYTVRSSCYNVSIKELENEDISSRYRDKHKA